MSVTCWVFFPGKLKDRIHLLPVSTSGAFLINCEGAKYGFFGNLEVISKTAFSILTACMDTCDTDTVADWKVGIEHGKHGPMREDINNWGNEVAIAGFQIIAMT